MGAIPQSRQAILTAVFRDTYRLTPGALLCVGGGGATVKISHITESALQGTGYEDLEQNS